MRLVEYMDIQGTIKVLTGLRVGGSSDLIEIGGNDSPVIRNPKTNEVYIPGSSIKGKMRYLTEWLEGKVSSDGRVHSCADSNCSVCRVYGRSADDAKGSKSGPTRIIVRDAYLTEGSRKELENLKLRTGNDTEIKYENSINRLTSEANPRNMERIPAGSEFSFVMSYKVLDIEDSGEMDREYFNEVVKRALKGLLLEGLGGGVSRGNGQFMFTSLTCNGVSIKEEVENITL